MEQGGKQVRIESILCLADTEDVLESKYDVGDRCGVDAGRERENIVSNSPVIVSNRSALLVGGKGSREEFAGIAR